MMYMLQKQNIISNSKGIRFSFATELPYDLLSKTILKKNTAQKAYNTRNNTHLYLWLFVYAKRDT